MTTEHDDPLPDADRSAFDALPRAIDPPPALEDRVVTALRADGTLRPPHRASRWWLAAAAIVFLTIGFGLGRIQTPAGEDTGGGRYVLLLYGALTATPAEETARVAEYRAWAGAEASAGRLLAGEKLGATAVALGADAPARASTEPAGFFIIRASTATDALDIANSCPHLKHGGTVVMRPIVETK